MAHFAQLNDENIVQQVIVISNDDAPTEEAGQAFIANTLRLGGVWKQTSYNTRYVYEYELDDSEPPQIISATIVGSEHTQGGTPFRGKYAGIGDVYDADNDQFVTPSIEVSEESE